MSARMLLSHVPSYWSATRNALLVFGMVCAAAVSAPAFASTVAYDAGALNFSSTGQSMWGQGSAYQVANTLFFGPQWNNAGGTIGGFVGSEHDCPLGGIFGCGDTRTGAEVSMHSSGKLGVEFGYSIDSGSVDTAANFGATANVPQTVAANTFFNIGAQSDLNQGTISTQSPWVSAYMSAVMQLSGSIGGTGCFVGNCSSSTSPLPSIDVNQKILSIDPNALDVLPDIRPDGQPLAELQLAGGSLTLSGGVGAPGFELSYTHGETIASTLPEGAPTTDLAELDFNVPDVATNGSGTGPTITSSGQDDLLSLSLDLDGLATEAIEAATGVPVPFGLDWKLGDFANIHLDLVDVDMGPYMNFSQDFEFDPNLYVNLAFSDPVDVLGQGWVTSWQGAWDAMPDFAISQTTTFTPTFYLEAQLTNNTGLIFGLDGTWTLFGIDGTLGPLNIPGTSLNDLLGWGHQMFDVQSDPVSVYSNTFALGGFGKILAPSFTIGLDEGTVIGPPGGGGVGTVPEPGDFLMLLFGLCVLAAWRRFDLRARRGVGDAHHA